MNFKFTVSGAFAAAFLSLAATSVSYADTYTEVGDAGDLPATAQVITGAANTPLTSVTGQLTLTNSISDSDLYEIYIANPGAFSASTTAFAPGANNFDSQLMLFSATTNLGLLANDDAASGGADSAIPAGSFSGPAGLYFIDISGSGRYAISTNGLIFPNYTDGTTDPSGTYGPTGPGGGAALSGYTGNSSEAGKYVLALAGAQFVVPEPTTYLYVAAGMAGLAFVTRARRAASRR